ncbi:MAG: alpha/beta hydrolase [Gammaproteobacteria bacterium]|nr:alpha/beta hydrolase [Gammaproteobacteria bacterium]
MKNFRNYTVNVDRFDPQVTTYKTRPLNVTPPTTHFFNTSDDVQLRLKRYKGGTKGPVILSHCTGVSSLMFAIDTIDVNLLEYLYNEGYDVWLLDYRLSIELPASQQLSTMDDVATKDYPAAVQTVCELAGVEKVQIVAHGVGASTLTMALLSGLENVSGAVCSQVSTHLYSVGINEFKAKLNAPTILRALGKKTMTSYTDINANFLTRAYDASLFFVPVPEHETCNSPVCHRISTIFGELYEHSQLNEDTHAALPRMFGRVNLSAMKQLTAILLNNKLIDANGDDTYLPHIDRLKLPMLFISGGNNDCVLSKSTQETIEMLADANGAEFYKRQEIGNYGHIDCIIGKDAARDVYPFILDLLESSQIQAVTKKESEKVKVDVAIDVKETA